MTFSCLAYRTPCAVRILRFIHGCHQLRAFCLRASPAFRILHLARRLHPASRAPSASREAQAACGTVSRLRYSFRSTFLVSVMSMQPGACVMAKGGLLFMTMDWGVTPHAQNTGTSTD